MIDFLGESTAPNAKGTRAEQFADTRVLDRAFP